MSPLRALPAAPSLPWGDILAGLSVAGVLLPESVAYAAIAGVPPSHALLAALVGLIVYPLFGSSRFAIVAPTSSAAAIFATAVAVGGPEMGYALVLLTGALFVMAGLLHTGSIGAFISRPVLRGFAWGLAVTIVLKQLPHLAGVHVPGRNAWQLLVGLIDAADAIHWPSVGLGAVALLLWLAVHHGLRRVVFLPQSLVVLALGIVASATFDLGSRGIALVGHIEWRSLALDLPSLSAERWLRMAEWAPALLLILFAESWGSVRSLALQKGDTLSADRELLAIGASNLLSGILQGLPVGAGFSAAAANYSAGARSKAAGLTAAFTLSLLLWHARDALGLLPLPVLAAVMIGILSHNLWPKAVITGLRMGGDAWLAVMAAAAVLAFGVLFGMLLAVGSSLLLAIHRFAQPVVVELGQLPGTRDYQDCQRHAEAIRTPELLILRVDEPLFFANAEQAFQSVRTMALERQPGVVVLSLEVCDELDVTAGEALAELATNLRSAGIELALARVKDRIRDALARAGLVGEIDHAIAAYWSVDDAVQATRLRKGASGGRQT
ncbi:MAG: SulP family inorganic anion transporter [Rhodocyclaceae bacterium]|nr:MAG: SulP family inorganic anion transporter [Rhodocyclaceae bacterium]